MTHFRGDLNIDHRIVNQAVITAARPKENSKVRELLSFETASSTEWSFGSYGNFNPDLFVDITDEFQLKCEAMSCYTGELCDQPHPRSLQSLEALAKYRGSQSGVLLAESFETIFRMS